MTETVEAAPAEPVESPAELTTLLTTVVSETPESTEGSPEQAETVPAKEGGPQGEQAVAPESYEFVAPEGHTIESDSAPIAAFSELAKSLNLSQEAAQDGLSKLVTAQATHVAAQANAQHEAWMAETRSDPVIGGDKLQSTLVKADQVLATISGGAALKAQLEITGQSSNREVLTFLAGVRDAISDERFVGGKRVDTPTSSAQDFYSKSAMNP